MNRQGSENGSHFSHTPVTMQRFIALTDSNAALISALYQKHIQDYGHLLITIIQTQKEKNQTFTTLAYYISEAV